jgi:hypothetical protein
MNMSVQPAATPILSILVPAHNAAGFIEASLRSILGQMGPSHELVLVDDGSRDRTAELADAMRAAHPQHAMRVVRQPNQGVSGARNRALQESRGQYIAFVDADDLLLPGALAALDDAIARHRPDVIACDFQYWHPDKECKNRVAGLGYPAGQVLTDSDRILQTFFSDRHMYVWANVMRRDIYMRLPQPVFPPGRVFEDVSVLSRLLSECASLVRVPCPTIAYRQHPASLTKSISARWCVDFAAALRQAREGFAARLLSPALRMQMDIAACHFYIGIVKNSYQLSWSAGRAAREQVRELFLASLFHDPDEVLAAMERGTAQSRDQALDGAVAGQVRRALSGSVWFSLAKACSRRIKLWQRMAA